MVDLIRQDRVTELPAELVEDTIYYVKRGDGDMDVVLVGNDGQPVYAQRQVIQLIGESTPGLLPAGGLFGRYLSTHALELLAGPSSAVIADVAATDEAILPVRVGATTVARARFPAGQAQAVIEILQPIIPPLALMLFEAPAVQDPTLSGVTATWSARRT